MSTTIQAAKFLDYAASKGWRVTRCDGTVITIETRFTPHDLDQFTVCDGEYHTILSMVPTTTSGSVWGTDGGGVGGLSALKSGRFEMNKSGVSKRFVKAVSKMLV